MCKCFDLVNKKLADYNGLLEFNLFAMTPRAMISVCKKQSRGKKPPLMEASFCPFCGKPYRNRKRDIAQGFAPQSPQRRADD